MLTGRGSGARASLVVLALLALLAAPVVASAQGYEVERTTGLLVERPAGARRLDVAAAPGTVAVPFPFRYFGETLTSVRVTDDGRMLTGRDPAPGRGGEAALDDGAIAPLAGLTGTLEVHTWIDGETPARRVVIAWERPDLTVQAQLHEDGDRIVFAYQVRAVTGDGAPSSHLSGLDEPGGARTVQLGPGGPAVVGVPTEDVVLAPRTVLANPPGIAKSSVTVTWRDARRESVTPDGCTKRCTYLAAGKQVFHVPDRVRTRQRKATEERLRAEDRVTFGGEPGDHARWVRQVLDGKILLLPADGGEPVRVWFRIVEYYSLDRTGTTLADHHIWNLRRMLSNALSSRDRENAMESFYAWKAMLSSRLSVGKLFDANQTDDAGRQFDSGRTNEYELWSAKLRVGTRGRLAPYASGGGEGWVRFRLEDEGGDAIPQRERRGDLRFVPDPAYVDGHYGYVIQAADNPYGWVTGRSVPPPPLRDEGIDVDPGREVTPTTGR